MSRPQVLTVVNQKGGVGKTTTTHSLAAALSRFHGKRVLAIDADAQTSLTLSCGLTRDVTPTLYDVVSGNASAREAIVHDKEIPFDIMPGDRSLVFVDVERRGRRNNDHLVSDITDRLDDYDYVIIDAARGYELVSVAALIAADGIIVPCEAQYLSQAGLEDEIAAIRDARQRSRARWIRVLFTRYTRSNHAQAVIENIREAGVPSFDTIIRTNIDLAAATGQGTDVFDYAPRSHGATDYRNLADEVTSL